MPHQPPAQVCRGEDLKASIVCLMIFLKHSAQFLSCNAGPDITVRHNVRDR